MSKSSRIPNRNQKFKYIWVTLNSQKYDKRLLWELHFFGWKEVLWIRIGFKADPDFIIMRIEILMGGAKPMRIRTKSWSRILDKLPVSSLQRSYHVFFCLRKVIFYLIVEKQVFLSSLKPWRRPSGAFFLWCQHDLPHRVGYTLHLSASLGGQAGWAQHFYWLCCQSVYSVVGQGIIRERWTAARQWLPI